MIMDLATELICCTPNIDYKEAKEIASKMLNRAEENGMLPPEIRYIRREACRYVHTGEVISFIKSSQLLNKWRPEEEDEEK